MGQRYLVDTNILIDFQMRLIPETGLRYVADIVDADFIISFISYIEFLGYSNASQNMEDFIALAEIIEVNKAIIDQTIKLRKSYKIKLPDAIIAATSIANNLTLISHNLKDFERIKELKVIDPYLL